MKTIGLIGAGHIGCQVAQLGVAHGGPRRTAEELCKDFAKTLRRRSSTGTSDDSLMEWHE